MSSASSTHPRSRALAIGTAALAVAMLASLAPAGCGNSKKSASDPAEQVKQAWTTFFEGSTPPAKRVALLQNGQRFAPLIQAEASSPLARQTKVVVSRVTLLGSNRAKVSYTITLAGQPALPNQTGIAVRSGGKWQVSDQSFCVLLSLQGAVAPACKGA